MNDLAPCPVCGQTPKIHEMKNGFVLSCVGARHTVAVTDEGQHAVSLYRGRSEAEVCEAWNKRFAKEQAA